MPKMIAVEAAHYDSNSDRIYITMPDDAHEYPNLQQKIGLRGQLFFEKGNFAYYQDGHGQWHFVDTFKRKDNAMFSINEAGDRVSAPRTESRKAISDRALWPHLKNVQGKNGEPGRAEAATEMIHCIMIIVSRDILSKEVFARNAALKNLKLPAWPYSIDMNTKDLLDHLVATTGFHRYFPSPEDKKRNRADDGGNTSRKR